MPKARKTKGHTTGGTDAYKSHNTKTAVDFKLPRHGNTTIGGGVKPETGKRTGSHKGEHAPVPGYSKPKVNSATDYKPDDKDEKPGGGTNHRKGR